MLEEPRQIGDDQEALVLIATDAGQHLLILGIEKLQTATPKSLVAFAQRDETPHPVQQRVRVVVLSFDMQALVMVFVIDDQR